MDTVPGELIGLIWLVFRKEKFQALEKVDVNYMYRCW